MKQIESVSPFVDTEKIDFFYYYSSSTLTFAFQNSFLLLTLFCDLPMPLLLYLPGYQDSAVLNVESKPETSV